jgi:phosphatidate cytidylyltransferase
MLTTRLWMGSVLIGLVVGMLVFDQNLRHYLVQLVFQVVLAYFGCRELIALLGPTRPTHKIMIYAGVLLLTIAPWLMDGGRSWKFGFLMTRYSLWENNLPTWAAILFLVTVFHLAIFLAELQAFTAPGFSFERMARTWWVIAYLGLLPTFFAQIRWLYPWESGLGTTALALAIFVPKGCDIGAYFTGRLIGKHPMTPVLSPKKTWEGAVGGLVFAALFAIGIDRFGPAPALQGNIGIEIAFGLTVGVAGMLGDLAESLVKRDCQQKDASQTVPGFGGVLDVVDAVIFAAPVAYLWLLTLQAMSEHRSV